jgi:hypothetical protein
MGKSKEILYTGAVGKMAAGRNCRQYDKSLPNYPLILPRQTKTKANESGVSISYCPSPLLVAAHFFIIKFNDLRLIHKYQAAPMPFPCHAVPLRV